MIIYQNKSTKPLSAFCRLARENGFEIYEMDLVCGGKMMRTLVDVLGLKEVKESDIERLREVLCISQ